MDVADFTIAVPDDDIDDLRSRLAASRWPRAWPEPAWAAATDEAPCAGWPTAAMAPISISSRPSR